MWHALLNALAPYRANTDTSVRITNQFSNAMHHTVTYYHRCERTSVAHFISLHNSIGLFNIYDKISQHHSIWMCGGWNTLIWTTNRSDPQWNSYSIWILNYFRINENAVFRKPNNQTIILATRKLFIPKNTWKLIWGQKFRICFYLFELRLIKISFHNWFKLWTHYGSFEQWR